MRNFPVRIYSPRLHFLNVWHLCDNDAIVNGYRWTKKKLRNDSSFNDGIVLYSNGYYLIIEHSALQE